MTTPLITPPVNTKVPSTPANVRIKSIALPVEHGGWAFLIEPLLLGMLIAPSLAAVFLCVSAFGVFLLYQPLQLMIKDLRRGKRYPRTIWAMRFVLIYSALIVMGSVGVMLTARPTFMPAVLAIIVAIPFACIQMLLVVRGQSRSAAAEICGAIALGATAPAIVLLGGWSTANALALWLVPMLRAATSILYVRARLRLARDTEADRVLPFAAHGLALLITGIAAVAKLLPLGALLAMVMLSVRAGYGLYAFRKDTPTRVIGFQEIGFGLLTIILVTVSYRWM